MKKNELANATFEALANAVIEAMESNPGEWSKSWISQAQAGAPLNATTGNAYRGGNYMWLLMAAWQNDYATNQWATFKQWKDYGYTVQRGQKSTVGVFFKPIRVKDGDKRDANGNQATKQIWIRNTFRVFNFAQVETNGPDQKPIHGDLSARLEGPARIEHAEEFFNGLGMTIQEGSPSFAPSTDVVRMPVIEAFESAEDYYATLAHEATHWTGHESRLNRLEFKRWGDEAYAFEELVAELGSVFVCAGILNLTPEPRADHAQYLAHWIKHVKSDPASMWTAATKAEHACRFMTDKVSPPAE